MPALIDANLLVSFLLKPHSQTATTDLVHRLLAGGFDVILSQQSVAELVDVTQRKPYLRERIDQQEVQSLLDDLASVAMIVPPLTGPVPQRGRDPKDDYLIETAIRDRADMIVSGDKDLLVLDPIDRIRIVSPAEFIALVNMGLTDL